MSFRSWQADGASRMYRIRSSSLTIWPELRTGWRIRWESFDLALLHTWSKLPATLRSMCLLYALLRPVSRTLSLLAVCFGLMGTAIFAAGEMLYFAAALPAVDTDVARAISPEAKATLTYLCLTIYGYGFGIFAMFYGVAAGIRGYLILRSGYLPRALGALVILGGASFIAENFLIVVTPRYHLPYVVAPMILAMASLMLWLLIKGVDRAQWDAKQAASAISGT